METSFPKKGILAALVIPVNADGDILRDSLHHHVTWLKSKGIHGILALGSTGEFPLLSLDQRKRALELIAEAANPLPVIANISDIRHGVVAELGRFARKLELPGVAIMPPYFYPSNSDDQLAWFLHAADCAQRPVMLYNFPELTGNRIDLETIRAFAERAPMAGIKQSGGEFEYHRELIALGKELDYRVFSGSDTRLPEVFELGACGCIGGLVNFVPELMVDQFQVHHEGREGELEPTASRMQEVGNIVDQCSFPYNVRAGLRARGFDPGQSGVLISDKSRERLENTYLAFRRKFDEWGLQPAGRPKTSNFDNS